MMPQPTVNAIVAAAEMDTARHDLSSQQRKRVYVVLYQTHVPKLDEADHAGQKPTGRFVQPLRRLRPSTRWTTSPTVRRGVRNDVSLLYPQSATG